MRKETFMAISKQAFGTTEDGRAVNLYHMENSAGASVDVLNFGARIRSIRVPDKKGELRDVTLGLNDVNGYLHDDAAIGAVCGRVANRIAKGKFTLNGTEYTLAINNGPNALHGGPTGFGMRVWDAKVKDDETLVLTYRAADMEEGYPGALTLSVTYGWSEDNELSIVYEATSDADTILNITNHAYFNLNGHDSGTVLDQLLTVDSDAITDFDEVQIPTGEIEKTAGTPFDFTAAKPIGRDIHGPHPQMKGETYDHNLVLNGSGFFEAAVLQSEESGIRMTCFTDQPGLQVYVNDYVLHNKGKGGIDYQPYSAVCLETQHFPDSINHPEFPTTVLKKGETFKSTTAYHFSVA